LFILYLVNTLLGYLCAHKRSLLLAYQRNDVENKLKTICLILMSIVQIVVIILTKNYYLFFVVNIIFTIVESLLVYRSAKKLFPEIKGKGCVLDIGTRKQISKNVAALSMHRIGAAVVFSTDNILVSTFCGVVILGAYSNYSLILNSIVAIITLLSNALIASFGNMIASKDNEYVYKKFKLVRVIFSVINIFVTTCLLTLFQPFIKIWTGGGIYLLEMQTVLILCISFYLSRSRKCVNMMQDAAGIFWEDRWKAVIEAVVNLFVSIMLAKFIGINGIFIGTIVSTIVAPLWVEPKVLYKYYFKKNVWDYFKRYIIDALIMVVVGCLTFFICSFIPDGGIWLLIAKFAVCGVVSCGLLILAYLPTKEFKECFAMAKSFVKNIFKKKKEK